MKTGRVLPLAVVAIILATIAVLIASGLVSENKQSVPSDQPHFTIVMSNSGFNGSATRTDAWPIMTVSKGQTITIRVINNDAVEAHGLAITHYFDSGVTLRPHQFYDITFVADQTGTFRVYCNIFCAIHPLMQNGQLVVNT